MCPGAHSGYTVQGTEKSERAVITECFMFPEPLRVSFMSHKKTKGVGREREEKKKRKKGKKVKHELVLCLDKENKN